MAAYSFHFIADIEKEGRMNFWARSGYKLARR
jgi:hypothetical protein